MSFSWSSPEPSRVVTGTAFGRPYERLEPVSPALRLDLIAGLLTAVLTVLAGAPVGLLWAALAPRAQAILSGTLYLRADPSSDAYIVGDGYFLAAGLLAGVATGLLAWWLGRAHGPAVVPGLVIGGFAAAAVAMRVGEAIGLQGLQAAVRAGQTTVDINLELGSVVALAGWPVAALLAYLVATLVTDR